MATFDLKDTPDWSDVRVCAMECVRNVNRITVGVSGSDTPGVKIILPLSYIPFGEQSGAFHKTVDFSITNESDYKSLLALQAKMKDIIEYVLDNEMEMKPFVFDSNKAYSPRIRGILSRKTAIYMNNVPSKKSVSIERGSKARAILGLKNINVKKDADDVYINWYIEQINIQPVKKGYSMIDSDDEEW